MDTEKFTERARGFIQSAQGLALRSNHQVFKPEHLLKVLLFDQAEEIAKKAGDSFVTAETLLLALAMAQGTEPARILSDARVKPQNLNAAIKDLRLGRTADSATAESGYDALKKYARDLTELA